MPVVAVGQLQLVREEGIGIGWVAGSPEDERARLGAVHPDPRLERELAAELNDRSRCHGDAQEVQHEVLRRRPEGSCRVRRLTDR
jgi:hypothetical protein